MGKEKVLSGHSACSGSGGPSAILCCASAQASIRAAWYCANAVVGVCMVGGVGLAGGLGVPDGCPHLLGTPSWS